MICGNVAVRGPNGVADVQQHTSAFSTVSILVEAVVAGNREFALEVTTRGIYPRLRDGYNFRLFIRYEGPKFKEFITNRHCNKREDLQLVH